MTDVKTYKIIQRDGQWCVTSRDGSRDFGCYPNEAEAKVRLGQVEAAKDTKKSSDDDTFVAVYAAMGVRFGVGKMKGDDLLSIASVSFDKSIWTLHSARSWLRANEFWGWDQFADEDEHYRFPVKDDSKFDADSMRTIDVDAGMRDATLTEVGTGVDYAVTKTEGGVAFPRAAYAYVPDPQKPSTWKLRLWETPALKETRRQIGMAVAAVGRGFRGQRADIPADDRPTVLNRIRAAWRKANEDGAELPQVLEMQLFSEVQDDWLAAAAVLLPDDPELKAYARNALKDRDIFRVGTWNGDKYSRDDLDDIVTAFPDQGFRVPIKLGHKEESGAPAYGWVENLRRVGDRLVADLVDLPKKVFDAVKAKRFDAVSAEIFWNLKRGEKTFRRALKAVALLGAEIPAVSGLGSLSDTFQGLVADATHVHAFDHKGAEYASARSSQMTEAEIAELQKSLEAAQQEVKDLKDAGGDGQLALTVKRLQEDLAATTKANEEAQERSRNDRVASEVEKLRVPAFRDHFHALFDLATRDEERKVAFTVEGKPQQVSPFHVLVDLRDRLNKQSEHLFREVSISAKARGSTARFGDMRRDDATGHDDPGVELDRLARIYMAEKAVADYGKAFAVVLADPENAELKRGYANGS